jgi:hypothetical protein
MKQSIIKQMIVATALGCAIMFIWGAFSHMVLLIGVGFTALPNEDKVIETLKSSIPEQGLYFFPGKDFRKKYAPEEESAFAKKFKFGPVGILVYRPVGGNPLSLDKLITQLLSEFIAVFVAAFITSLILGSYWKRVFVVTLLGGLACVAVSTIYWNWYEFPTPFFLAQLIDITVGFFLAGLIIAKIVPQPNFKNEIIVSK